MFVIDVAYGDFVAWNKFKTIIIRVEKDQRFWDLEYPKTKNFFYNIIMAELLGRFFTRDNIGFRLS